MMLINIPIFLFYFYTAPYFSKAVEDFLIVFLILDQILMNIYLFRTAMTDPGVITPIIPH